MALKEEDLHRWQPQTWNDGDCDAQPSAVCDKFGEAVHIIEELCDDDLCSSINLQSGQHSAHAGWKSGQLPPLSSLRCFKLHEECNGPNLDEFAAVYPWRTLAQTSDLQTALSLGTCKITPRSPKL